MSQTEAQTEFLRPAEVARQLNISISQVHRVLRSGDLPCLRMGPQTVRVRRADLEAYIIRLLEKSQRVQ